MRSPKAKVSDSRIPPPTETFHVFCERGPRTDWVEHHQEFALIHTGIDKLHIGLCGLASESRFK
jgi:hypothetical protein